jgi:hypothetical protein
VKPAKPRAAAKPNAPGSGTGTKVRSRSLPDWLRLKEPLLRALAKPLVFRRNFSGSKPVIPLLAATMDQV